MNANSKGSIFLASLLLILISSLPYVIANNTAPDEYVFSGFLVNPLDGNSYLAKMRQGMEGHWSFTLPYTANPGEGTYINLYYLFLGHIARGVRWPLIFTYHAARVLAIPLLVFALSNFYKGTIKDEQPRLVAFWLSIFGSGLGWTLLPFIPAESITSDFWVAEAYPFLSSYISPHFTLGMALQLFVITPSKHPEKLQATAIKGLCGGFFLSVVSPFFIPVAGLVLLGMTLLEWFGPEDPRQGIYRLVGLAFGAGPVLLYDFWVVSNHPALMGWTAQNQTPSPPGWDVFVSFSPALVFAVAGFWFVIRNFKNPGKEMGVWLFAALLAISIPFALQRRFISGMYIPLVGLAVLGIWRAIDFKDHWRKLIIMLVVIISLPTNIIILSTSAYAIQTHDSKVYLTKGEWDAFTWVSQNIPAGALFLSSPETGLFIPAHTNSRVIYGHPFETVDARERENSVREFFSKLNEQKRKKYIEENSIEYLFIGPRERLLGSGDWDQFGSIVYNSNGVEIYLIDLEGQAGELE